MSGSTDVPEQPEQPEQLKGANWHILFCHIELELWLALPDVRTFSQMEAVRQAVCLQTAPAGADDILKKKIERMNNMILFCVLGSCLFCLDLGWLWHSALNFDDDIHVLCLELLVKIIQRENYAKIEDFRNGRTKYNEDFKRVVFFILDLLPSVLD